MANKDFTQRGTVTGGTTTGSGKISHGPDGGVNMYKTKDGKRAVEYNGNTFYEYDRGSGTFILSTGGTSRQNYMTIKDYDSKPPEEPKPEPKPKSSGGSKVPKKGTGDRTPSYGTTNPQPGNTGSKELDATTKALMEMVTALTASIANIGSTPESDAADVSAPAAPAASAGLGGTILGGGYDATKEKKKKSYLTPISVG